MKDPENSQHSSSPLTSSSSKYLWITSMCKRANPVRKCGNKSEHCTFNMSGMAFISYWFECAYNYVVYNNRFHFFFKKALWPSFKLWMFRCDPSGSAFWYLQDLGLGRALQRYDIMGIPWSCWFCITIKLKVSQWATNCISICGKTYLIEGEKI